MPNVSADTLARFENRGVDPMRPLLPPQSLWLRVDELFSELKNWPRVQLKTEHLPTKAANANLGFQKLPDLAVQAQQKRRWMRCVSSSSLSTVRWCSR